MSEKAPEMNNGFTSTSTNESYTYTYEEKEQKEAQKVISEIEDNKSEVEKNLSEDNKEEALIAIENANNQIKDVQEKMSQAKKDGDINAYTKLYEEKKNLETIIDVNNGDFTNLDAKELHSDLNNRELSEEIAKQEKLLAVIGDTASPDTLQKLASLKQVAEKRKETKDVKETTKEEMERLKKEEDEAEKRKRLENIMNDDTSEKAPENLEKNQKTDANNISEVEDILKSIAWMEGKNKDFSTNSGILREKQKMRELVKSGKIDALEAEVLMQDAKKGKIEKNLITFAGRINEKTRDYKARKWFGQYTSWMNKGPRWARIAKRVGTTALIGGTFGAIGIAAGGVALGTAAIAGAGYSVARLGASAGAGALAGSLHRGLTRKDLHKDEARYKEMIKNERATKKENRLSPDDIKSLRSLRKNKELTDAEKEKLVDLETRYAIYSGDMKRSSKNYRELLHRRRSKNEKNRMLWAGAAGLAVGFGSSYMLPRADALALVDNSGASGIESTGIGGGTSTDIETTIDIKAKPESISGDIFINKNEGITDAFLRQLQHSSELREHLGITGEPTGADAFKVAQQLGYVGENSEVRVNWGKGAGYELKLSDGKLISHEHFGGSVDAAGNYIGGEIRESHGLGSSSFEGQNIEGRNTPENYEYLKNTHETIETKTNSDITHTERATVEDNSGITHTERPVVEDTSGITHTERVVAEDNSDITHTERTNPTPIEDQEYTHTTETTFEDTPENADNRYDPFGKSRQQIRRELKQLYDNGDITKTEHRYMKREYLRGGDTWVGKNKGWLAGLGLVAADAIEDGKIDVFGIFDRKGSGIPPVIENTPDEGFGGNTTGGNESGGSNNNGGFGANGAGGNLRAHMNSYVNRLNDRFK